MQPHRQTTFRLALLAAMALGTTAYGQILFIDSSTGLFAPSFRDLTDADLGNTTFYGWSQGSFDGGVDNELMENPVPSLSLGGLNGTLNQLSTVDILAGGNYIFVGVNGRTETLTMQIPTVGSPGLFGFTTIIIQGRTLISNPPSDMIVNFPSFGEINGISPTFVIGTTFENRGQWWAKYEIPGNEALYDLSVGVKNVGGQGVLLSITDLTVDTQYSTTGYAPDTAVVPEPASIGLLGLGGIALARRRRGLGTK